MNNKYEIVDIFWKAAGLPIQVVRIPEVDVEEKLSLLSNEAGISRYEYENFILNKCLIDIDRIGRFISSNSSSTAEEQGLLDELMNHIIEINPLLNPELLVISKNSVLKISSDKDPGVCRLVENPRWMEPPKDDIGDMLEDLNNVMPINLFSDEPEESLSNNSGDKVADHSIISKKWEAVGITLRIRKFDKKDMDDIFGKCYSFAGKQSYKMFIIMRCIIDYTTVMITIDSMGVTADMPPTEIAEILYNFSAEVNPFLKIEEIDPNIVKIGQATKVGAKKQGPTRRTATPKTTTTAAQETKTAKEEKKSFASISNEELLTLADRMKLLLVGQDKVVESVVDAIHIAGAGLRDPARPIGAFMFTGDTGVGKTYCAKVLAKELCGDTRNIVRVDCSEYSQAHEVSKLIGSPPGYIGHDAGGFLTNQIIETPFSVVLFDELEKAHSKLYDMLLQLLDEGRLTDSKGTVVDFSDCVIILTSNIGTTDVKSIGKRVGFGDVAVITANRREEAIDKALKRHFRPEFLNRVDSIMTFNSLGKAECYKIIDLMFEEVSTYLAVKNISLSPSTALKEEVFKRGFSKEYGARPLRRTIEKDVVKPLAHKILVGEIADGADVLADFVDGNIVFSMKKPKRSAQMTKTSTKTSVVKEK